MSPAHAMPACVLPKGSSMEQGGTAWYPLPTITTVLLQL